ncbi:MAG: TRAP transporter small permease subunit [Streptosporangiales bacterium]|nr:TRAP transporter small permease subunit [Streptosporangiales bacterium]
MTTRAPRSASSEPSGHIAQINKAAKQAVLIVERAAEWLVVLALALLVVVVNAEVFSRFVLDRSLTWNLEVSRILFIWIVFLGASLAVRKSAYSSIEIFSRRFPQWWKRRAVPTVTFAFGVAFAVLGLMYVDHGGSQVYVLTGIPVIVTHVAPLVFGVLVAVFAAANALDAPEVRPAADESLASKEVMMG